MLILAITSSAGHAESAIDPANLPPWLKPELLVHLVAMDLNESQKAEFREALIECFSGLQRVVQREIRKGGVDIPRRIKRATNREYSKLDKRMKASLAEPQLEPWANYLEGLKVAMAESAV
ncbi:MAG: hypothetical protein VCA12_14740 [Pseudomonadales bacterium]